LAKQFEVPARVPEIFLMSFGTTGGRGERLTNRSSQLLTAERTIAQHVPWIVRKCADLVYAGKFGGGRQHIALDAGKVLTWENPAARPAHQAQGL
jgi:hypothetical protein